ncbi:MAG: hypothetical protein LH660_13920 [Phormidesmis sp. CAN_BIN36]|nr:hypothetical protein [Phormidesmis sp. CAN_BIN36]
MAKSAGLISQRLKLRSDGEDGLIRLQDSLTHSKQSTQAKGRTTYE